LSRNSICFGQFLCPSSGVLHCTFGIGICQQPCMTNVEFLDKNKFVKISASVRFFKRNSKTIFFLRVKDQVSHCSNIRIYGLCLDSGWKDEIFLP
jgi:hypothetical protein